LPPELQNAERYDAWEESSGQENDATVWWAARSLLSVGLGQSAKPDLQIAI